MSMMCRCCCYLCRTSWTRRAAARPTHLTPLTAAPPRLIASTASAFQTVPPPLAAAVAASQRPLQPLHERQLAQRLLRRAVDVLAVAGHLVAQQHVVQLVGLRHRLEHAFGRLLCQRLLACKRGRGGQRFGQTWENLPLLLCFPSAGEQTSITPHPSPPPPRRTTHRRRAAPCSPAAAAS